MDLSTYMKLDVTDMIALIQQREVTPYELVELSFQQLEKVNPSLNGVTYDRKEKVLEEAKRLDLSKSSIAGVPMLLKDSITQALKGEKSTSGSKLFKERTAISESHFIQKLRQAGSLLIGHTNTPEFGLKSITEPELFGPTLNPWNTHYSTGGSSGGAAAMVASGVVPVAGASDGGGSIRVPASFTSLVGLKPTRGRTPVGPGVGRQWHGAAIDFVLSKSVRDSALMLDNLHVFQSETAFQAQRYNGVYTEVMKTNFEKSLRIAYTINSPIDTPVSSEAKEAVLKTVHLLRSQGHIVEEKENDVDEWQLMKDFFVVVSTETAVMIEQIEQVIGRKVKRTDVEMETWILNEAGKSISATQLSTSINGWDHASIQMGHFHDTYDFFITPTTAFTAPKIGELTHSTSYLNELSQRISLVNKHEQQAIIHEMFLPSQTYTPFTQLANVTGQPAISLPLHITKEGLPLGVQVMAPKGNEHELLKIAYQLEQTELWVGMKGNPYFK